MTVRGGAFKRRFVAAPTLPFRYADVRPTVFPPPPMPTAIVMLKTDRKRVTGIAEKLLDLPDVSEVYSVSGRFDLLVMIKCEQLDKIEGVITDQLLKTDGILESETLFAFRSYDKREGGNAISVD